MSKSANSYEAILYRAAFAVGDGGRVEIEEDADLILFDAEGEECTDEPPDCKLPLEIWNELGRPETIKLTVEAVRDDGSE